jgi:hypothetical protein
MFHRLGIESIAREENNANLKLQQRTMLDEQCAYRQQQISNDLTPSLTLKNRVIDNEENRLYTQGKKGHFHRMLSSGISYNEEEAQARAVRQAAQAADLDAQIAANATRRIEEKQKQRKDDEQYLQYIDKVQRSAIHKSPEITSNNNISIIENQKNKVNDDTGIFIEKQNENKNIESCSYNGNDISSTLAITKTEIPSYESGTRTSSIQHLEAALKDVQTRMNKLLTSVPINIAFEAYRKASSSIGSFNNFEQRNDISSLTSQFQNLLKETELIQAAHACALGVETSERYQANFNNAMQQKNLTFNQRIDKDIDASTFDVINKKKQTNEKNDLHLRQVHDIISNSSSLSKPKYTAAFGRGNSGIESAQERRRKGDERIKLESARQKGVHTTTSHIKMPKSVNRLLENNDKNIKMVPKFMLKRQELAKDQIIRSKSQFIAAPIGETYS